jgi:hypothetical protein
MLAALSLLASVLTVDDIVNRHVEARGGLERIKAIRTVVYSKGQYREPGFTGSGKAFMALMRPYYKVVSDPEDPTATFREGWDGSAWEWFADPGIVIRTVGPASAAMRHGIDLEGPFVDYRTKGTTIVAGGETVVDGRPCHRLVVTLRDGFVRDYLIDKATFLVVAERQSAPIHATGPSVRSETRVGHYGEVAGVLFPYSYVETEIATGKILSEMRWGSIEVNRDLPLAWFSPPEFRRTPLQRMLEQLYMERTDPQAVLWTYRDFTRAHPDIDAKKGIEFIAFQMRKMGDAAAAAALGH